MTHASLRGLLTEERGKRPARRYELAPDLRQRSELFGYILLYRWLALVPPLLGLVASGRPGAAAWALLGTAAGYNLGVTLFHPILNTLVLRRPWLMAADVLFCSVVLTLSGGEASPYYLYALSPLFASGLFFRTRGGITSAAGMTAAYAAAVLVRSLGWGTAVDVSLMTIHVAGFFLIGGLFSNFTSLLEDQRASTRLLEQVRTELVRKTAELQRTNRELRSLHALAVGLQEAAVDVRDVQRKVLSLLTGELGYPRAFLGLVDHGDLSLTGWMAASAGGSLTQEVPATLRVPLNQSGGPFARALTSRAVQEVEGQLDPSLEGCRLGRGLVLPLLIRDLPVGVLVVELPEGEASRQDAVPLLTSVAHQAALALWSTRMCVERAQRFAVQEERNRIARDIHDTVSQCLFGTVYTLESCLRLIPEDQAVLRERLEAVLRASTKTLRDIRGLIFDMWVGGLTTAEFVAELKSYVQDLGPPEGLEVDISVQGDLTELTPFTRKHLFRIAQEALANVVRHAHARRATVHLAADSHVVQLTVQDDGVGFDLREAGMGIQGMRERALAVGGTLALHSVPGGGTRVEVRVPRLACVSSPPFGS